MKRNTIGEREQQPTTLPTKTTTANHQRPKDQPTDAWTRHGGKGKGKHDATDK